MVQENLKLTRQTKKKKKARSEAFYVKIIQLMRQKICNNRSEVVIFAQYNMKQKKSVKI